VQRINVADSSIQVTDLFIFSVNQ